MLTNTLKRLAYWARTTKKPSPQPIPQSNPKQQQSGYSHPISPTLKKIDKRFNDAQQKQMKQQQLMIKGFEDFKNAIMKDNESRKKTKEQQMKDAEKRLQSLQIPLDLRERFRQIANNNSKNTRQQIQLNNNNNNTNIRSQDQYTEQQKQLMKALYNDPIDYATMKSAQITGGIKSQQQAQMMKRMLFEKQDPLIEHKLRQDIMIEQILKGSKTKQAQLNFPKDWKKQLQDKKKVKQQEESLLNEKMRYQKLKQLSAQEKGVTLKNKSIESSSQLKKLDRLTGNYKIEISPDELWREKYSPQLIEKALEYKNKQLHYFKELIEGDHRDQWDSIREGDMMKPLKEDKQRKRNKRQAIQAYQENLHKQVGTVVTPVQEEGLTRYKDLQYYREKGVKQFETLQNMHEYDIELRDAATKDIKQVNKLSDIYMDDFEDKQEYRLYKKELYQESSFGKYEMKLKQLSKKISSLGIEHDFEDLALLKKEELFADKKMQQQNESYKQYLIKKEKKKHMKEELKKIHKQKLREDLNFDYQLDPVKLQKLDPADMQQGLKKMQQIRKMKQSTIVSSQFLKQKIHHTKTFKAMSQFISAYFYNHFQNPNNTITEKVQIGNILPNRKNTVLNVFWQFHSNYTKVMGKYKFNDNDIKREKDTLQKILQKQSTYISSKMTEYLGLRYGPDIRFYFNEILDETKQSVNQMKKYKEQIIELTVEEYKEKGVIKTKEQQDDYRRKIQVLATNNIQDMNNQKKLLSKHFQKKQKISLKYQERKQRKNKRSNQQNEEDYKIKRKLSEKDLSEVTLQKIITDKVQAKKESIFTPYIQDEDLYFGEKEFLTEEMRKNVGVKGASQKANSDALKSEVNKERKIKRSPVQRLWDEIEKGI